MDGSTLSRGHGLAVVQTMSQYRETLDEQTQLNRAQRRTLIDQATILLRDLYVHMPLKRAMHAVDPVQRLRLLRLRMDTLDDREFHADLLDIFTGLRDLHTNYLLPTPYRGKLAFLGVLLERYESGDGTPHWIVSKVFDHLVTDATLVEGVEVSHWNGTPIELAVWQQAHRGAGSNLAARFARGLENMTFRSLASLMAPDADWVDLRYETSGGAIHESRLLWRVYDGASEILTGAADPQELRDALITPLRYQVAVDLNTETIRRAKKELFAPAAVKEQRRVERRAGKALRPTKAQQAAKLIPTTRPDEITARTVDTSSGEFGYLRLWTFHMADNDIVAFVNEVINLLENELPTAGLIIDVRGNGGGFVIAAEFLLQFFTPNLIAPEPSQFINTTGTLSLTSTVASMREWRDSIEQATETGAQYSKGIPLSAPAVVNDIGQLYHGPVVLITDASCYSACDMFAAGFQDHNIGPILGVDANTGAGGANVLTHEDLRDDWVDGPLETLPRNASMRVSLRRTLRVGENAGQPVEDLGVVPDELHAMTKDDLMFSNRDLLDRAGELLDAQTPRQFDVVVTSGGGLDLNVELRSLNVERVDVYVNERPQFSQTVPSNIENLAVRRLSAAGDTTIRLEGFDNGKLVAARTVTLGP